MMNCMMNSAGLLRSGLPSTLAMASKAIAQNTRAISSNSAGLSSSLNNSILSGARLSAQAATGRLSSDVTQSLQQPRFGALIPLRALQSGSVGALSDKSDRSNKSERLDRLVENLWKNYIEFNPQVLEIHQHFKDRGEEVVNDHIAFRTFDRDCMNIEKMQHAFVELGYEPKGEYFFTDKKLRAVHFEHPEQGRPKIFLSEQQTDKCSPQLNKIVDQLCEQLESDLVEQDNFSYSGRHWGTPSFDNYERLSQESEYASWVYVHGFRPNHFTVLVNQLKTFGEKPSLQSVNEFVKSQGYTLNQSGGEIKGTPEIKLEQSSTMAGEIPITFDQGNILVPACYYEFALRHDGFEGFLENNAAKVFDSTNKIR